MPSKELALKALVINGVVLLSALNACLIVWIAAKMACTIQTLCQ